MDNLHDFCYCSAMSEKFVFLAAIWNIASFFVFFVKMKNSWCKTVSGEITLWKKRSERDVSVMQKGMEY